MKKNKKKNGKTHSISTIGRKGKKKKKKKNGKTHSISNFIIL